MTTAAQTTILQPNGSPAPAARPAAPSIITRGARPAPARIFLYGVGGIGKTTFAVDSGALILDVEDGSWQIDCPRVESQHIDTWPKLLGILERIAAGAAPFGEFKRIAVDTIDRAELLIHRFIVERDKPRSKEGLVGTLEAYGYGKGPDIALDEVRKLLSVVERIRSRGVDVLLLGHPTVAKKPNPTGDDYEAYSPKIHKKSAGAIFESFDATLFAEFNKETYRGKLKMQKSGARVLHTRSSVAWDAKNRWSLPGDMDFDPEQLWTLIRRRQEPARLREDIEAILVQIRDQEYIETVDGYLKTAGSAADKLVRVLEKVRAKQEAEEAAERAGEVVAPPPAEREPGEEG